MNEVRCPMCGKLNPPELDDCQYCQARLKPLIVSQPPEEGDSQDFEQTALPSDGEQNLPDWLKDLRSQDDQPPEREVTGSEEELPGTPGEEDWLERLQERGEEEEELPGDTEADQEEELPLDWQSEVETPGMEEIPAWLREVDIESLSVEAFETDEGAEPEPEEEEKEETSEEVGELEGEEEDRGEMPAWIKDLKQDQPASELPFEEELDIEAEQPELEEVELPDWLLDMRVDEEIEEEEDEEPTGWLTQVEQETPSEAEESVEAEPEDWLAAIGEQKDELEAQPEEAPEWISALESGEDEGPVEYPTEAEAEDLEQEKPPEWMAELEKEFGSVSDSIEAAQESEIPSIVGEVGIEKTEEPEETEEIIDYPLEEAAEELEQEEPPKWMAELEKEFSAGSLSSETVEEIESSPVVDEEGVTEATIELPSVTAEDGVDFLESMPEWVEEVHSEEELESEAEESELEEAEIPSWLESMRPVESVAPQVVEEEEADAEFVETSGPLTGLSGVLKADSDFSRVRKPPVYSIKLRVTENQEARVAMLRDLLAAEDKQKPFPSKPIITPLYIFRLVIALALIIPIAWAVITGAMNSPMEGSSSIPAGVMDVRRLIDNQLSTNSPVLIAFDYEAGFSGELDTPSSAVLSHMMDKGAFLTLVSTSPSGPLMAERLINDLNESSIRQASPFSSYANLGYVPGGSAGLISLAQSPQETVPFTLDNVVIWESAPLDRIVTVADFSMILVITENSETARAWIEQVQPVLDTGGTPLIMVVSAQAGPLVMPYYQASTKQVQGLIVGFPDGVAYSSMTGQGDLAEGSWDAFNISMLATEIVLVVGAFVGVGSRLFTSNKEEEN